MKKLCQECGLKWANRPRGLCWNCYYRPGVKESYGVSDKFGPKRWPIYTGQPPSAPTQAIPGTPEKIAVLQSRASQGVDLHHEWDATFASMAQDIPE